MVRYSLVVPVFNEEANIAPLLRELVEALSGLHASFEIILVNDASTDASLERIEAACRTHPECRCLSFKQNRGQSAALYAGFQAARGEYVITLDADLQNDPRDIEKMIPYLGDYDMVNGWRRERNDRWIKRISSKIANGVRNRMTGETIRDTGCSLKIMRADLLKRIKMFKGMHRFLPTLMKMEGARVIEIPVSHRHRQFGVSKYGTWSRAVGGFRDLLAVRWMQSRFIRFELEELGDD